VKLKEFWKANWEGFVISGSIVSLGCLLFYAKHKAPLEVTIPSGWLMVLVFMFFFGFLFGGND